MKRPLVPIVVAVVLAALTVVACTQAAPAPTPVKPTAAPAKAAEPTKAPAPAPTKAAEPTKAAAAPAPTKAPTAPPTVAPAKKVAFPEKGRTITMIAPFPAGGDSDFVARMVGMVLEKELGVPVQTVNKAGGGTQVGLTEFVRAKPDGYTLAVTNTPGTSVTYFDPERKAIYSRKDFAPFASVAVAMTSIGVKGSSPFQTLKDLVDAAKAKPEAVKAGTPGLATAPHMHLEAFQKAAGVKLALVHFDGGPPELAALLGGHVDVTFQSVSTWNNLHRTGEVRLLAVMGEKENRFAPGVKTLEQQGYKVYGTQVRMLSAVGGTPPEILEILAAPLKKALEDPEIVKKFNDFSLETEYMGPAESAAYWDKNEAAWKESYELAKR